MTTNTGARAGLATWQQSIRHALATGTSSSPSVATSRDGIRASRPTSRSEPLPRPASVHASFRIAASDSIAFASTWKSAQLSELEQGCELSADELAIARITDPDEPGSWETDQ